VKYVALIALLFLPIASAQTALEKKSGCPVFRGLLQQYKNFRDIRPTPENPSDSSVFLSSFHPKAAARLLRYNNQMKEWEAGQWTMYCGSTVGVTKPIEIKSGESLRPNIYWQVSTNDWDKPTALKLKAGNCPKWSVR